MKASEEIKELIKGWEGLRLTAYRCPAGVLTIGYGHTGPDVIPGLRISRERAAELFEADLARFEAELNRWMTIDGASLGQAQYDAVLSFAYNVGTSALRRSTLWKKACKNADDPSIPAEFRKWTRAGGNVLPGLVKRREREAAIYAGGDYGISYNTKEKPPCNRTS